MDDIEWLNELLVEHNIKPIRQADGLWNEGDESPLWEDVQFISSLKARLINR